MDGRPDSSSKLKSLYPRELAKKKVSMSIRHRTLHTLYAFNQSTRVCVLLRSFSKSEQMY